MHVQSCCFAYKTLTLSFSSASLDLKVPNNDHEQRNENAWRAKEGGDEHAPSSAQAQQQYYENDSRYGPTPKNTYSENVDKNTRDTKSSSWLNPKRSWRHTKDGIRITRRYPLRRTPCAIAHVRYIKILTWIRNFLVIFLYLVWFSLCSSLFFGITRQQSLE